MKTLYAGPYTHEFGHELFSFQAYIRKQSESFDRTYVSCRESMKFLYKDFADQFVPVNEPPILCHNHITMGHCMRSVARGVGNFAYEQKYIPYGAETDGFDIIIHARNKPGKMSINLDESFYESLWQNLSEEYSVAFVGTREQSLCPPKAADLRGIPLSNLADIMYSSSLIVGQSSGPIHFSSLCRTPHLTWGGYRLRTYARYSHHWNPFKTPCFMLESTTDNYLSNRVRKARLPRDILTQKHFNILESKNYRQPSVKELLLYIREALGSQVLGEHNEEKRMRNTN